MRGDGCERELGELDADVFVARRRQWSAQVEILNVDSESFFLVRYSRVEEDLHNIEAGGASRDVIRDRK